MKRISTLLMASMAVLGAFAQQEVGIVDAASFTSEAEARAAGTVVAQSESITMTIGAEDNYKQTGAASNGFSSLAKQIWARRLFKDLAILRILIAVILTRHCFLLLRVLSSLSK